MFLSGSALAELPPLGRVVESHEASVIGHNTESNICTAVLAAINLLNDRRRNHAINQVKVESFMRNQTFMRALMAPVVSYSFSSSNSSSSAL